MHIVDNCLLQYDKIQKCPRTAADKSKMSLLNLYVTVKLFFDQHVFMPKG